MAKAADIVVNLLAKTASFQRGMTRSERKLKGFSRATGTATKVMRSFGGILAAVGAGAGAAGFVGLIKNTVKANDEVAKMATTLGIATDSLRGFQLAAELYGVPAASLNKALTKQRKAIVDAANGLTTYSRHFDRLGLSVDDLLKSSPEEQFIKIGTAIGELSSNTERLAVEYDLFGGRNVRLNALLVNSAQALGDATEKAKQFGAALSGADAAGFEVAADQFAYMKAAAEGIKNSIVRETLPGVLILSNKLQSGATYANQQRDAFHEIAYSVVQQVSAVAATFKLWKAIGGLILAIGARITEFMIKPFEYLERRVRAIINFAPKMFGGKTLVAAETFSGTLLDGVESFRREMDDWVLDFDGLVAESDQMVGAWVRAQREVGKLADETQRAREGLVGEDAGLTEFLRQQDQAVQSLARQKELASLVGQTRSKEQKIIETIARIQVGIRDNEGDINELVDARGKYVEQLLTYRLEESDAAKIIASTRGQEYQILKNIITLQEAVARREVDINEAAKARKILVEQLLEARKDESGVAAIIASTRTAEENTLANIVALQIAIRDNEGDINAIIEARNRLVKQLLENRQGESTLSQFGIQAARNMQTAFADFFHFTESGFRGLLQSFVKMLQDMVAELLARQLLLSFFGLFKNSGGSIGSFATGALSGIQAAATGASARAGQPFLVGEKGPELFVPNTSGMILPAAKTGARQAASMAMSDGGGQHINITVNNHIDSRSDREQLRAELGPIVSQSVEASVGRVRQLSRQGKLL